MSKSLIEGASPAEELLLSFKQPPQPEIAPDEEEQPQPEKKEAAPKKPRKPRKPRAGSKAAKKAEYAAGKRTYRINLALTPMLGEALKAEAERQGRSVNNLTENIIKEYLTK